MGCMRAIDSPSIWPRSFVVAGAAAIVLGGPLVVAQSRSAVPADPSTQTIAHVLDRIGFGARPGDIERVKAIGLSAYIDQQLHPEKIDNSTLESRLADFETINLSTRELSEKYFAPAIEMRRSLAARQQRADAQAAR